MLFGRKKSSAEAGDNIPAHIAIIMDGNGRWAQARGLPRPAGHSAGSEAFRRIATHLNGLGVQYLTVYAFSTENWKRPRAEVEAIMGLLEKYLMEAIRSMAQENIRLAFFGDTLALPPRLQALIAETQNIALQPGGLAVNVCLNYGGRAEITRSVRQIAEAVRRGELKPEDITEETVSDHLYSAGIPGPDLIIRTGGERRVSNFLLWQGAYSEYYFTDVLWPDFDVKELERALADYGRRSRRFGDIS